MESRTASMEYIISGERHVYVRSWEAFSRRLLELPMGSETSSFLHAPEDLSVIRSG